MTQNVASSAEVVAAFVRGDLAPNRTPVAPVPGGRRVSVDTLPDGTRALYSYRTIVAVCLPDGAFAITPKRYGPSTGKLLGRIRTALAHRSWTVDGGTVPVTVAVPGRWGGFGPAWYATGVETLPFVLWT